MVQLNVGVIGAGSRSRSHLPVLLKLGDRYKLKAICDIDGAIAKGAAEETGAKPYTDIEEMLGKERLDVCLIAIQAEGHHIVAKALAERGVHILTETPIAITAACAHQLIEATRDRDIVIEVSENVPRWPHERLKQKVVADGLLGDVNRFYLSYTSGSFHGLAAIRSILRSEGASVVGMFPSGASVLERAEISFVNNVRGIYEFNRDKGNYWEIVGSNGALMGGELHILEGNHRYEIVN
jgi:predicted dehydrogenase